MKQDYNLKIIAKKMKGEKKELINYILENNLDLIINKIANIEDLEIDSDIKDEIEDILINNYENYLNRFKNYEYQNGFNDEELKIILKKKGYIEIGSGSESYSNYLENKKLLKEFENSNEKSKLNKSIYYFEILGPGYLEDMILQKSNKNISEEDYYELYSFGQNIIEKIIENIGDEMLDNFYRDNE